MTKTQTVLQTRMLNASISDVWNAWTQPDLMRQWFCPLGMKVVEAEADLRVGGMFRIVMEASNAGMRPPSEMGEFLTASGTYQQVELHQKLVFSWAWEGRDEVSLVTITLTPKGDQTVLVLEHIGLLNEASRIFHEDGWTPTLDNLSQHLAASNT